MSTTTIDYTQDIAAISGDFPEQVVTLAFTCDEMVLTCDGTVVRGRISMNDLLPTFTSALSCARPSTEKPRLCHPCHGGG